MDDTEALRIGDVVRRTGLTERMIRHYEHKGLIAPRRSAAGQRMFGSDELTRLAIIQLLKRAGMSLPAIGAWLSEGVDAKNLVKAELALLRADAQRLSEAIAAMEVLQAELADEARLDVAQLTRIFKSTAPTSSEERAAAFFKRHFALADRAGWGDMLERLTSEVEPEDYNQAWHTLAQDIAGALPLDPASASAQRLLQRWDDLLAPFLRVADSKQQQLARTMWTNVDQWGAAHDQPVTAEVVDFITRARAARHDKQ